MKKTDFYFKLTDLTEKITDGSHNPPKGIDHSSFLMLSSRNIFNDEINTEKVRYLTEEDFEIENRRTDLKDLDVLLTIVGTIGRSAVFDKELGNIVLQRSVAVLRPIQSKINSRFLMYNLQSKLSTLLSESRGVAQQGFYLEQLRNLIIYTPPLIVQREIVGKLDKAFVEIDSLEKNIQLKGEKTNQLLRSMLNYEFTSTDHFDVKVVKLEEVSEVGNGNSAPQDKRFFLNGVFPFIRTSDVGRIGVGKINSARDLLNQEGIIGLKIHQAGTVLFPKSGASTFLNHRVIMEIPAYISSHLATIKAHESLVLNEYLYYFLQTIDSRNLCQDQSYPSLNRNQIESINIPLPSLEIQKQIVKKLDKAFIEIEKLKNQISIEKERVLSLRQSILSNAFNSEEKAS